MSRLILMSVLFLTGCAVRAPEIVLPEALTDPVIVECREGQTSRSLGECAMALREGLTIANSKLTRIAEVFAPE